MDNWCVSVVDRAAVVLDARIALGCSGIVCGAYAAVLETSNSGTEERQHIKREKLSLGVRNSKGRSLCTRTETYWPVMKQRCEMAAERNQKQGKVIFDEESREYGS